MILLSSPLKMTPRKPRWAHFFSRNWDSHNQNSQLKKFEKSVVSFCRRWTSLKHVLPLYAWVQSKQQSSQNTHHHIAELNASWKNHYSSNRPHPYYKMKPLSNRLQKKWEKLYVKLSSRGQLNSKISFSWDQLKNWIHFGIYWNVDIICPLLFRLVRVCCLPRRDGV